MLCQQFPGLTPAIDLNSPFFCKRILLLFNSSTVVFICSKRDSLSAAVLYVYSVENLRFIVSLIYIKVDLTLEFRWYSIFVCFQIARKIGPIRLLRKKIKKLSGHHLANFFLNESNWTTFFIACKKVSVVSIHELLKLSLF